MQPIADRTKQLPSCAFSDIPSNRIDQRSIQLRAGPIASRFHVFSAELPSVVENTLPEHDWHTGHTIRYTNAIQPRLHKLFIAWRAVDRVSHPMARIVTNSGPAKETTEVPL